MKIRTLFTLLLLPIFLTYGSGFARKRISSCCKCNERTPSKTHTCEEEDDLYYDYKNDIIKFGIVQKIPYTHTGSGCNTLQIDFSSACIRCGMCLAIADKINHTLLDVHEITSTPYLNDTEVELLLRTICDHSFEYYRLRECDGKKLICDYLPGSTLLSTSADGLWGNKLRELCHYYLNEIGELELYRHWQKWCNDEENFADISDVICRSEMGLLRDCRNMEAPEKYELPLNTYNAKVKITATYGKYGGNH